MGWIKERKYPVATEHPCFPPGSSDSENIRFRHQRRMCYLIHDVGVKSGSLWQCDDCGSIWKVRSFGGSTQSWHRRKDKTPSKRQVRKMAKQLGLR